MVAFLQHFRRLVDKRPAVLPGIMLGIAIRQAEVHNFGGTVLVDDDVLGFDVTVDDALAVDEAQAFEEMGGEVF